MPIRQLTATSVASVLTAATASRWVCAFTFALTFSSSANAQNMKPGLWEISQKMKFGSAQANDAMAGMQEQLAKMPPEQRKQMQEMMAQKGVNVDLNSMGGSGGAGGPGVITIKTCMTQAMADRNEMPPAQNGCTATQSPRIGNTMKMAFACTKPPSSGEGMVTFTSSDAYNMKMVITSTVKGKPEKLEMDGTGKWLGSSCGDVKPIELPKK